MDKKTAQIHAPMNPYKEHLNHYANPLPTPSIAFDPAAEVVVEGSVDVSGEIEIETNDEGGQSDDGDEAS